MRGPRGGLYVLGPAGQHLTPAQGRVMAELPPGAGTRNILGREILRGDRGWFVRDDRGHITLPRLPRALRVPRAPRPPVAPRAPRAPRAPATVFLSARSTPRATAPPAAPPARSPSVPREQLLEELRQECYNEDDPVTMEAFADLPVEELRNVVRVGPGPRKHCYQLESIFGVYKTGRDAGRAPRDPLNRSHSLTNAETANINAKMGRRNASYRPPGGRGGGRRIVYRPPDFTLRVEPVRPRPPGGRDYWKLDVMSRGGGRESVFYPLGVIPEVSVRETGSTQDTTAVLLATLSHMLDNGGLLVNRPDGSVRVTVHVRTRMSHWQDNLLPKFLALSREIRETA